MTKIDERAADIANRLLSRDLTAKRLLKVRRLLCDDPWKRPGVINPDLVAALLVAIEQHPKGGADTRDYVHNGIVNMPTRTLPPLPPDIAEKVEAFQKARAAKQAASR